jgi:hypothetical protein
VSVLSACPQALRLPIRYSFFAIPPISGVLSACPQTPAAPISSPVFWLIAPPPHPPWGVSCPRVRGVLSVCPRILRAPISSPAFRDFCRFRACDPFGRSRFGSVIVIESVDFVTQDGGGRCSVRVSANTLGTDFVARFRDFCRFRAGDPFGKSRVWRGIVVETPISCLPRRRRTGSAHLGCGQRLAAALVGWSGEPAVADHGGNQ